MAYGNIEIGKLGRDLREEVEKLVLDLSGKMDRRRDVETFCSNLQMQMNFMKMGEERSVVSHWKMKKEWEKKNIYIHIYISCCTVV